MRSRTERPTNWVLALAAFAAAFLAVLMLSCGPVYNSGVGDPFRDTGAGECPTVEIHNQLWYDVAVYQYRPRIRVATVVSQTVQRVRMCQAKGSPSDLRVELIGSREGRTVEGMGASTFETGDTWIMQVSDIRANEWLRPRD